MSTQPVNHRHVDGRERVGLSDEPRTSKSLSVPSTSGHTNTEQTVKRIAIFGRPGSGKSVFAESLCKALDVPLYNLDCYYFGANWAVRNKAQFLSWQQGVVDQDRWILDGNNVDSLEMRYARADVAIYFNRSRLLCYWRVIKRRLSSRERASDRPANCPEEIAWKLLTYMWRYGRMMSGRIHYLQEKYPHVQLYEITRESDVETVLQRVVGQDIE